MKHRNKNGIKDEGKQEKTIYVQQDLFSFMDEKKQEKKDMELQSVVNELRKEKKAQQAILEIQKKYGKNSIMKGMNLNEEATGNASDDVKAAADYVTADVDDDGLAKAVMKYVFGA